MAPPMRDMSDEMCVRPWYAISVNANGDVRCCCLEDSPVIGNLNESSVREVWNGAKAESLRLSVNSEKPLGECGACVLRNLPYVSTAALRMQMAQ